MKELQAPHNDWWRADRPLPTGAPWEPRLQPVLDVLVDSAVLARAVARGEQRLLDARAEIDQAVGWQERLRPLFCPVEVNLASAPAPLDGSASVAIPSGFWLDGRLGHVAVSVPTAAYTLALAKRGMHFPESARADGDHGWLTPVKAASDVWAVEALRMRGLVSEKDVLDVLAVDRTEPVFSAARCSLLPLVPERGIHWRAGFVVNLRAVERENTLQGRAARVLLRHMTDASHDVSWHAAQAEAFARTCAARHSSGAEVDELLSLLVQRRADVAANAISKNPLGQIMEPGFRVIFPNAPAAGGRLQLDDTCAVRLIAG